MISAKSSVSVGVRVGVGDGLHLAQILFPIFLKFRGPGGSLIITA